MPGPLTPISFDLTGTNQDKDDKKLQPGEWTELKNYRRTEEGSVEKRLGSTRRDIEVFNGAAFAGPATGLEASETNVIVQDIQGQLFAEDPVTGEAHYRGTVRRAHPAWFNVENLANPGGASQPLMVRRGDDLWTFALGCYNDVTLSYAYQVTVTGIDGVTKLETATVDVSHAGDGICSYAACVDADDVVWLLSVNGYDGTIECHKFAAVTASPVVSTYHTEASAAFVQIDAIAYGSTVIVAALSDIDSGADRVSGVFRSYAAISGGVATATSFTTSTCAGAAGVEGTTALSILDWDMSDAHYNIAYLKLDPASATKTKLTVERVAAAAPGTTSVNVLFGSYAVLHTLISGSVSGFVDPNTGGRCVYVTVAELNVDRSFISKNRLQVDRHVLDEGVVTSTFGLCRSASVASKFFRVDDRYHFLTHFDDDDNSGVGGVGGNQQIGIQNGYWLRDSSGKIVTGILDGQAGVSFFGTLSDGTVGTPGTHYGSAKRAHVVTPVVLSDTEFAFPLLDAGIVRTRPGRSIAIVDFAATYHSTAEGIVLGIPCQVSARDSLTELSPIHYPYSRAVLSYGAGGIARTFWFTWLYRTIDSDQRVGRSAPYPVLLEAIAIDTDGDSMSFDLPTSRHQIGGNVEIELYGSAADENGNATSSLLYLQDSFSNDPNVDAVTVVFNPAAWRAVGEPLYSTNGIPNIAPEPSRLCWTQGNRTVLGGTASGEIWPSFEVQAGALPSFHTALNYRLQPGLGELKAGIEVDANTSALFTESAIVLMTGQPDGRASGGWTPTVVTTTKGCNNPFAVAKGPDGAIYFPDSKTGRMQVLLGGRVQDIAKGMVAYKSLAWVSAVDVPAERLIRWIALDGRRLSLQYDYPQPDQPLGTWILDEGEGLPIVAGSRLLNGVHTSVESNDDAGALSIWNPSPGVTDADFTDDGAAVLTEAVTGRMGLNGFTNQFDSDWVTLSSTHLGGDSTFAYTVTPDSGIPEVHPDVANDETDLTFRTACRRTKAVRLRIRETSATGRGRKFDQVTIEVRPRKMKRPYRQVG